MKRSWFKKLLTAVLTAVFCGMPYAAVQCAEAADTDIIIEQVTGRSGETVPLTVTVRSTKRFANVNLSLRYDPRLSFLTDGAASAEYDYDGHGYAAATLNDAEHILGIGMTSLKAMRECEFTLYVTVPADAKRGEQFPVTAENAELLTLDWEMIAFTCTDGAVTAECPERMAGDLNGDGRLTVADVILGVRMAAEDSSLKPDAAVIAAADFDGDGMLTPADFREMMHHLTAFV